MLTSASGRGSGGGSARSVGGASGGELWESMMELERPGEEKKKRWEAYTEARSGREVDAAAARSVSSDEDENKVPSEVARVKVEVAVEFSEEVMS